MVYSVGILELSGLMLRPQASVGSPKKGGVQQSVGGSQTNRCRGGEISKVRSGVTAANKVLCLCSQVTFNEAQEPLGHIYSN